METGFEIAVIGMAGRFPGARNIHEFWENLEAGRESITMFTREELFAENFSPEMLSHPNFVGAKAIIDDIEYFDAAFFGYSEAEAKMLDPQIRLLHEAAWEALEDAGYTPESYSNIGMYAGVNDNPQWRTNVFLLEPMSYAVPWLHISNKDHACTRVSYSLNLGGPSFNLDTQCSTSLVAIHLACQGLLAGECNLALAGGASLLLPHKSGYIYEEGSIFSPDGHCRAFDEQANGTVFGEGVGVVALKRLKDAIEDRDNIYAVVKGSAINNDGNNKLNYMAPSIERQSAVVKMACELAEVEPGSIGYVEAHGTATYIGDAIEVEGLKRAFGNLPSASCRIGSVKTNIGHTYSAAGVAGFTKTVLSLKKGQIPPTLHFETPNHRIDFDNAPFIVNDKLFAWSGNGRPRRAGVNSFGIGGTNAHVVLEEAPRYEVETNRPPTHLLLLSARTESALDQVSTRLADHLAANPAIYLADVAYTLLVGRRHFAHRKAIVSETVEGAIAALREPGTNRAATAQATSHPSVVFLFSGQGSQYVDMGRELYEKVPNFRKHIDACFDAIPKDSGQVLREILYPTDRVEPESEKINQTSATQPLLFVIEYALARLLMDWGIEPDMMIGHSVGEYTAACLAGVLSMADAMTLLQLRGKLMESCEPGRMLSVPLSEEDLVEYLSDSVELAAVNSPRLSVLSGDEDSLTRVQEALSRKQIDSTLLHTSHAFHSRMMEPILSAYEAAVQKIDFGKPAIPYISNLTGTWITEDQVRDPGYWAQHIRNPVRFHAGLTELLKKDGPVCVEVGPGNALSTFVRQHGHGRPMQVVTNTLRHAQEKKDDLEVLLASVGKLWVAGVKPGQPKFYLEGECRRVSLPTYPFERKYFWIDFAAQDEILKTFAGEQRNKPENWFCVPSWRRTGQLRVTNSSRHSDARSYLVFSNQSKECVAVNKVLGKSFSGATTVIPGKAFDVADSGEITMDPASKEDYRALFAHLAKTGIPEKILYMWCLGNPEIDRPDIAKKTTEEASFAALVYLTQAIHEVQQANEFEIFIIVDQFCRVFGDETVDPQKALLLGPAYVIPQENPEIKCRILDVSDASFFKNKTRVGKQIIAELGHATSDKIIAFRNGTRWTQSYEPVDAVPEDELSTVFRQHGTYVITGGLGKIGVAISEYLAENFSANLVLLGRTELPDRENWQDAGNSENDKIQSILRIEAKGCKVLALRADVGNTVEMRSALDKAEAEFGALHGVIHAAGIVEQIASQIPVSDLDCEDWQRQLHPKVQGTRVLDNVLADRELDFCLLISSISVVLGGLGLAAYAAGNAFLDGTVLKNREQKTRWLTINWDNWQMATDDQGSLGAFNDLGMTTEEGQWTMAQSLAMADNQVVVSTRDLNARIRQWVELRPQQEQSEEDATNGEVQSRPSIGAEYVPPGSTSEAQLANIWKQLLQLDQVGVLDNFFELGGDSLKAMNLVSRVHKELGVRLPLVELFSKQTIRDLSGFIENARDQSTVEIKLAEPKPYYELSSAQKRMYILQSMAGDGIMYNIPVVLVMEGEFDRERLKTSFAQVLQRHESLRTSFHIVDDRPVQKIEERVRIKIEQLNGDIDDIDQIAHDFVRPFDLTQAPLVRMGFLKLSDDKTALILDIHHIITDELSILLLVEELTRTYADEKIAPPALQYRDYSEWQNARKHTPEILAQRTFWLNLFSDGVSTPQLPTDFARPEGVGTEGLRATYPLDKALVRKTRDLAQETESTLYMVLLAVVSILLSRICNQDDIVVGTPVLGRGNKDLANCLGIFTNTLLMGNQPKRESQFLSFLQDVKERTLLALANQDYQFEDLVDELSKATEVSGTLLLSVIFALRQKRPDAEKLAFAEGHKLTQYDFMTKTAICDLLIAVEEKDDTFNLEMIYRNDLFKKTTIDKVHTFFVEVLEAVVTNHDIRLGDIELEQQVLGVDTKSEELDVDGFSF